MVRHDSPLRDEPVQRGRAHGDLIKKDQEIQDDQRGRDGRGRVDGRGGTQGDHARCAAEAQSRFDRSWERSITARAALPVAMTPRAPSRLQSNAYIDVRDSDRW